MKRKKEKELDPASLGPDGALQYYSKVGDLEAMRKAYKEGAKVNVPERGGAIEPDSNHPITGDYPLHMAAGGGHMEAVNELLNWESDIEAKNRIGSTALLRAVSHDQPDIVKRLLKDGASIEVTNKIGNTALHCAAFVGSMEVTRLLLEAQASAHILQTNKFGATPLMIASKTSAPLAKYLLSQRPGSSRYGGGGGSSEEVKETKEVKEKRSSLVGEKRSSSPEKRSSVTGEKRSSVPGDKRLSVNKHLSSEPMSPSTEDIASPSGVETRTIAAPSVALPTGEMNLELAALSSTVTIETDDRG